MMARPLRVLQVLDTLGMGGAETWLMELLRRWSRTGEVEIDFLLTSGNRGVFDDEAATLGAGLHYNRYGRDRAAAFVSAYRSLLATGRYDAIHDHSDFASGWRYLMGVGVLPPVRVTHVHNPTYQIRNNIGVTLSRRLVARAGRQLVASFATYIAATSGQVLREYGFEEPLFRKMSKGPVYCGFDPARFADDNGMARRAICNEFNFADDAKIVLFVGRIDQSPDLGAPQNHKNSGFAIDVVIAAARADSDLCAIFAGAPSPASRVLQERIAAAGLESRIKLTGVRPDIEYLMCASDVLLLPSRAEGLGMVAVEAQAAGLPVLASTGVPRECIAAPDLIEFKAVEDGVASWAETILAQSTRPKAAAYGNRLVSQSPFAIETSAKALQAIYAGGAPQ